MKKWIAMLALGLAPIVFLPVTQDFYDTNKLVLLALVAFALSLISGVGIIVHKKSPVALASAGVIAFGGLFVASLASFFFASTSKIDALMAPLGSVSILSFLIILSALARPSAQLKTWLLGIFTGGSAILGLIAIYQFAGMGRVMFPGIGFLQDPLWTPTGTTTTTLALFVISVPLILPTIRKSIFSIASLLVIIAGAGVTVKEFITKIPSAVLPLPAGWAITLETLKHAKTMLVGAGVENFVSAYTLGKPLSMIATGLWNVRFGVNADFFLHMTTVYGLIGVLAAAFFAWQCIKQFNSPYRPANIVYVVCLFFVPPTITLLAAGAVLFVLSDPGHENASPSRATWVRYPIGAFLVLLGASGLYGVSRAYQGELQYFMALSAAQKSEGTKTYNLHLAAIATNPYVARYHITFSQINLSLANSTTSETSSQLIAQAISEAKTAVTRNPQNIAGWENLGAIYQVLMPVAQGSDTWAAAAYQKALSMDPTNPVLLTNLGGAFVHMTKYDDAIQAFEKAVALKPDYANGYFNLAHAYKLKGDIVAAEAALTKTMGLVAPDSADFTKVKNELDVLGE